MSSVADEGFEPPKAMPADLQSAPFGRLGNLPRQQRRPPRTGNNGSLVRNTSTVQNSARIQTWTRHPTGALPRGPDAVLTAADVFGGQGITPDDVDLGGPAEAAAILRGLRCWRRTQQGLWTP